MAEEPQPSTIREGASSPTSYPADPVPPASAEDRKAAAALSSLDAPPDDDEKSKKSDVDQKALGEAMSRLEILEAASGTGKGKKEKREESEFEKKQRERKEKEEEERERRRKVKVDAGDVALLVQELELTKVKATELLKAHDGNAVKAMTAFVQVK